MAKASGYGLGIACFALVAATMAGATQFKVGGDNGWSVAGANAESFNTWAMKNRFQIGDSLVFAYPKDKDSVLLVQPSDYNSCNTSSYVKKFADGNTVFTLDRSGAFFFISGVEASCRANEKLIVMVLAGRNGTGTGGAPPPSSPSPPPAASTAPPPSSTPPALPSPPPATSPPPSSASSPPPATTPTAPAPKAPSPTSAPPPATAPATTPTSPPPSSSPPAPPNPSPVSPPSAPAGGPPPASAPGGANPTGAASPPPAGSGDRNGAVVTVTAAGLAGSVGACIVGYAMLAL